MPSLRPAPRRKALAPTLLMAGLIAVVGGWLLWFGGQGGVAGPPPESPPPSPLVSPTSSTVIMTVPTTESTTAIIPPVIDSPYGAREDGSWVLPALGDGPDIESRDFADGTLVVAVSPNCAPCIETARAAVAVAPLVGVVDPVVIVTAYGDRSEDELLALAHGWQIPGVRFARDVVLGARYARSDILPDALPIVGVWSGSPHGGWNLLTDGAYDVDGLRFAMAAGGLLSGAADPPEYVGDGWAAIEWPWGDEPRYQMATAVMGDDLLIWGGTFNATDERLPSLPEGWVWTAESGWRAMAPGPLCPLVTPGAVVVGSEMMVWGAPAADGCARQAAYDPAADTWRALDAALLDRAGRTSALVWTGELLVGPTVGWAYDPLTGADIEIPPVPGPFSSTTEVEAHWDGERVLAIGAGALYGSAPGDTEWETLGNPTVGRIARDSAYAADGLYVVDYDMAVSHFDGAAWHRRESLPLRFYECVPNAGVVAATVVVQMCSGYALADNALGSWVVLPLGGYYGGALYGADTIFEIGANIRRFAVERDDDGRILLPASVPVGVFHLELGDDWDLRSGVGATQVEEPGRPPAEVVSFAVESKAGDRCRLSGRYGGSGAPKQGAAYVEVVSQRTRRPLAALLVPAGVWDDFEHVLVGSRHGSDTVDIVCDDVDTSLELAGRLWSPWE